ncbi:Kelch repeat-containing protein [Poritiphilus flavus]|uniref:Galactose oxidase n=1 Tax=Poritiphilus flavus TaxID=2697053 RepID=A0A6L9EGM7_9FLAO|nr:galactose oxidase [Poritiphilus flavus]NAS13833.1 galactose oxidase [Poritiphilus flavus]
MAHIWKVLLLPIVLLNVYACKNDQKNRSDTEELQQMEESESPSEASWRYVTSEDGSLPVARHEAAFARVGDKFYLLGGRGDRATSIFDTSTNTWTEGPEPPLEMHHFQPVVVGSKIYILGAFTGGWPDETPIPHIYIYDTETDTWTQGDEIPENRRRASTGNILHNGKIYMLCGIKNGHIGDHKDWADSYDTATGSWEILVDAPRTRDHFQAVLHKGKIYALAGRNTGSTDTPFGGTIAEVDAYDIASNNWSSTSDPIPTERAGTAAILYMGQILVGGGESTVQEKAHAEVEALDPETGNWTVFPELNEGRHGTGLVGFEGQLYIASGCGNRGGSPELTTVERLGGE